MKNSKLISGTSMVILLATIASGCGAPKENNKEENQDNQSVVETVKTENPKSDNPSTDAGQTIDSTTKDNQSEPGKSEEQKTEELKAKSPIDVVMDALSKLNTKTIDMNINSKFKNKDGNEQTTKLHYKSIFEDDNIEFLIQAESEGKSNSSVYKDNYLYTFYTSEGEEEKSKFPIDKEKIKGFLNLMSPTNGDLGSIQRDIFSSVNVESSDNSSVTYSVTISDKDKIEENAATFSNTLGSLVYFLPEDSELKLIFVIDNNGNLVKYSTEISIEDETLNLEIVINAFGDKVTLVEIPSDADSYEEIQLPDYGSLDVTDNEDGIEDNDNNGDSDEDA